MARAMSFCLMTAASLRCAPACSTTVPAADLTGGPCSTRPRPWLQRCRSDPWQQRPRSLWTVPCASQLRPSLLRGSADPGGCSRLTQISEDLALASRNLPYFDVRPAAVSRVPPRYSATGWRLTRWCGFLQTVNTYDLLKRTVLIVTLDGARELERRLL